MASIAPEDRHSIRVIPPFWPSFGNPEIANLDVRFIKKKSVKVIFTFQSWRAY
jgi:hypothetical protein